ncbi:MAG: hypothetical protein DPW14_14840 [Planctomycetes bacterium]|nr:hypothetical protein [Planctomycetota bacterium]
MACGSAFFAGFFAAFFATFFAGFFAAFFTAFFAGFLAAFFAGFLAFLAIRFLLGEPPRSRTQRPLQRTTWAGVPRLRKTEGVLRVRFALPALCRGRPKPRLGRDKIQVRTGLCHAYKIRVLSSAGSWP